MPVRGICWNPRSHSRGLRGESKMNNFQYSRATDTVSALEQAGRSQAGLFIAGGTNLVDLMREGIMRPDTVVDVTRLPLDSIEEHEGGLRIGAMVRNSHLA